MNRKWVGYGVITAALMGYGLLLCRTGWMCDDAFITFRTIDNFLNGFGLRWNVLERVQPYTHPLWMVLEMAVYYFTREAFLSTIFLCIAVSMAAVGMAACGLARKTMPALFLITGCSFSRAFVDYSTSGLENPLSHLLLAAFLVAFFQDQPSRRSLFFMSSIAALATLNRMDSILIYLPALAFLWLRQPSIKNGIVLALGFLPFLGWEIFSIIYYGFPFPNTAYAKLGTGLDPFVLIQQGLWYFNYTLQRDCITFFLIALGLIMPFFLRDLRMMMIALGGFLYLLYIVRIGGDFMGGRFLTLPLFAALMLLARLPGQGRIRTWGPILFGLMLLSMIQPNAPILTGPDFGKNASKFKDAHQVGDERMYYFQVAGLSKWAPGKEMPTHTYAIKGREYRAMNQNMTRQHGSIGFRGYFAGPKVHIIDYYALADPLLARIPSVYSPNWRIGHFFRKVPVGYEQSATGDKNVFADKNIGLFFDQIKCITRAPIWNRDRWIAIWKMNRGEFDYLINKDRCRFPDIQSVPLASLSASTSPAMGAQRTTPMRIGGLEVSLTDRKYDPRLSIFMDGANRYQLLFMDNTAILFTLEVGPGKSDNKGLAQYDLTIPDDLAQKGYNALRIMPFSGNKRYFLGRLEFPSAAYTIPVPTPIESSTPALEPTPAVSEEAPPAQ